jgi:hypothetical protein
VFEVGRKHYWAIEQDLLGLGLPHLVVVPILVRIARIPLEPLEAGEELIRDAHARCI